MMSSTLAQNSGRFSFDSILGSDPRGSLAEEIITEESLAGPVRFLSDTLCEGRAMQTRGGVEAAAWIVRQFEHFGLVPLSFPHISGILPPAPEYIRSFRLDGKTGHNVIGLCPASAPAREYIIVAAHYDNLGLLSGRYYPGADSNASGVSALLNLAHVFRSLSVLGRISGKNILFVALDGKQISMAGARSFCDCLESGLLVNPYDGHRIRRDDISMMVNLDILGGTLEPVHKGRGDYLIMLSSDSSFQRRMTEANMSSGLYMDVSFDYYGSRDFTDLFLNRIGDQSVFIGHKIPSTLFTSGITMLTNKVEDIPESLDMAVLRKRTLLIFRWLEKFLD